VSHWFHDGDGPVMRIITPCSRKKSGVRYSKMSWYMTRPSPAAHAL
jgi:hypothetical protein